MIHTFRLRILLTTCFLAALLLAPAAMAQPDECKGKAVAIVHVTIDDEKVVSVDKDKVTIARQGRVCWEITGLAEGESLTMEGKSGTDDQFHKQSVSPPRSFINSGVASRPGTFNYNLVLKRGDEPVYTLDPQVIIEPGG